MPHQRSHFTDERSAHHCVGLLLMAVFCCGAAAQTEVPTATIKPTPCAPVQIRGSAGMVPSIPEEPANASLIAALRLGYHQFYALHQDTLANVTLKAARTSAMGKSTCAEALAVFALAQIAENSDFRNAEPLYQTALQLFSQLDSLEGTARSHFGLGNVYVLMSKNTEAVEQYGLTAKDFARDGNITSELVAEIAMATKTNHEFSGLVEKARANHLPCVEAEAEQFWADFRHTAGDYKQAMEHDVLADALYVHCPESKDIRAGVQTSMGRLERQQGRPEVALEHYRLALRLQQESGDPSYIPQTYNAMAIAYEHMNDPKSAIRMYKQGLVVARQIHSRPFIDFLEANLGAEYSKDGQFGKSISLLEQVTKDLKNDGLGCVRFTQLGQAYIRSGRVLHGVEILQVALAKCRSVGNAEEVEGALDDLAGAKLLLHRNEDALRDAREGLELLEHRRSHLVPSDAYKQGFINENAALHDDAIAALTAMGQPVEALSAAEQARGRAFLDLLGSHQSSGGGDSGPDAFTHSFEQYRKDLIASPESVAPLSSEAMLAEVARRHATLLAYWIGPKTLYIWVAQPGGPVMEVTRPISSGQIASMVDATRPKARLGAARLQPWLALYQLLIAPVEKELPKEGGSLLTIIPSGPLFALSFPALLSPDRRYLVERFRMHVVPTIGLLAFTQHNADAADKMAPRFLFLDNPQTMPSSQGMVLARLPGSVAETDAVVRLLPAAQVKRLEGPSATANNLRAEATGATAIHFATHAVLDDANPYDSFLALDDARHDGRMSVADIYGLNLHSRFVVLSACSTGLGKITGDGVVGMSRAFFYAGAASVLSTLWDVADRPMAGMLPRFYAAIAQGQPTSGALRTAQLSMLHDLRRGRIRVPTLSGSARLPPDPAYWAAFTLTGEP